MSERKVNATMADAIALETKAPQRLLMQRAWRNVARLPQRTARSFARLWDRGYRLERRAQRELTNRLPRTRLRALRAIIGTSSDKECCLLAHLAMQAPAGGEIVEIGAWKGRTTAWLVEGSQLRADPLPVTSIDPHAFGSWDEYQRVLAEFQLPQRGLTAVRESSSQVGHGWSKPISLLWIDGSHDYADVLADIRLFVPHVMPGGCVVFDDAVGGLFPGVEQAIQEEMAGRPGFARRATIRHLQLFAREAKSQTRAA
ncbi:MAG: class I SAM-dependent methyltransferase [Pirellulales bacterium]